MGGVLINNGSPGVVRFTYALLYKTPSLPAHDFGLSTRIFVHCEPSAFWIIKTKFSSPSRAAETCGLSALEIGTSVYCGRIHFVVLECREGVTLQPRHEVVDLPGTLPAWAKYRRTRRVVFLFYDSFRDGIVFVANIVRMACAVHYHNSTLYCVV